MERRILKVNEKIKLKKPSKKVIIILAVCILAVISAAIAFAALNKKETNTMDVKVATVKVTRGSITNVVEGSGVLEANEQYDITALVSGDILADYFSEGDMVEKDKVLYRIDSASIEKNIEKSNNQLRQAQLSYNEAEKSLRDLNCTAPCSGTITKMYVKEGDKISNGAKVCDIIDNETMTLTLPFIASQADTLYIGQSARVEIVGDSNTYSGSVISISGGSQTNSFGVATKNVEISVTNPGGILNSDKATAVVGSVACSAPGSFEYAENVTVYAESSGTVESVNFMESDRVYKGNTIIKIDNASVENQVTKARLSLNDAQISINDLKDDLEQYSIKAPISGKIIQKNSKAGDKLGAGAQSSQTVMAVVADLSQFKLTINIDELEVSQLKVGQRASVAVDALDGQIFEGTVNNISIIGTSSNGVTTYPVEIVIPADENSALIPGMNVDATIVIEEKKDILLLPATAINRGNTVTKNGEKVKVEIGITDGKMVEIISGVSEGDEVTFESVMAAPNAQEGMGGMMGGMGGAMPGGMGGTMPGGMGGAMPGGMGGGMPSMGGGARGGMSGGGMPGGMMR